MSSDQPVVLGTEVFHLSRAKQKTDANRRKFTANLQGIVAHQPRVRSGMTSTPHQRHQHHRRGISTSEVQSSYHGITTRMKSVFNSGKHCVTSTVLCQGHRAGHITPGQRNIANVKQNFVSEANIYLPFCGYNPRRPQQHVQIQRSVAIAPEVSTELKRQRDLRPPPKYDSPGALKLRSLLPVVEEGLQVLFRSPDDGWYYAGTVSRDCSDYMYIITDGYGHQEQVWREDIISDADRKSKLTTGQKERLTKMFVVTQHPRYAFSYAPGEVVAKDKGKVKVKLYDGKKTGWTFDFAPISKWKYDNVVTYIAKMREQWLGQKVLARIPSGTYELGTVSKCVNGHQYKVTWTPIKGGSNSTIVDVRHLFGSLTPYREIQRDGYVLAPFEASYLPAKVIEKNGGKMTVTFVENSVRDVEESDCFWISPFYYYDAIAVYFNARMREGEGETAGKREKEE